MSSPSRQPAQLSLPSAMAKKKGKKSKQPQPQSQVAHPPSTPTTSSTILTPNSTPTSTSYSTSVVIIDWVNYTGDGRLAHWNQLLKDVGIEEEFPSKTQCKKKLDTVFVNIKDFLSAIENGIPVHHFPSRSALVKYTKKHTYPKDNIVKGSPLRQLLVDVFAVPRGKKGGDKSLEKRMAALAI
ncbi:hypothetical protein GGS20DRAFT_568298 [Poronia punctata]|nr:hypothetical protein GGS20DRAFT_568298 [Poronia punctata]